MWFKGGKQVGKGGGGGKAGQWDGANVGTKAFSFSKAWISSLSCLLAAPITPTDHPLFLLFDIALLSQACEDRGDELETQVYEAGASRHS